MVRRNLRPDRWGSSAWKFIDSVVDGYDEKPTRRETTELTNFLTSLATVMPCDKCRESFSEYLHDKPIKKVANSKKAVRKWLRDYRNKKPDSKTATKNTKKT